VNDLIENAKLLMNPDDYRQMDRDTDETTHQMGIYEIDASYCEGDTPLFI